VGVYQLLDATLHRSLRRRPPARAAKRAVAAGRSSAAA